jgi:methyltransferase
MSSVTWFTLLIAAVAVERVIELVVSARHLAWARERGALESGAGHYPFMAAVHSLLLVSCVVEVHLADRPFVPWLGWPMLAVVAGTQALRWWCVRTLGPQWNTRIVVVPGLPLVARGPYRLLRHPNYVAVVLEVAALPLVHTAWLTAVVFSLLDVVVLSIRIPAEQRALAAAG